MHRPTLLPARPLPCLLASLPLLSAALPAQAQVDADSVRWQGLLLLQPLLLGAMLLIMALVLTLLVRQHGRERPLLWLAGAMALWALGPALPWIWPDALGNGPAAVLNQCLLPWAALCLPQYLMRAIGWERRWLNLLLLIQAVLLPLSLGVAGDPGQRLLINGLWAAWLTLQLLTALAWQLRLRRQAMQDGERNADDDAATPVRQREYRLMVLLFAGAALGTLLQLWMLRRFGMQGLIVLRIAMPVLLLSLGVQAVLRLSRAHGEIDGMKLQYEQLLQTRLGEVEHSYAELAEQKLEQVTERERKRIAADLHDDLGAKLLTIVHTSESDRISTLAREALEEMRLSVRGLTGKPVQLLDALGDWRAEVVSRLGQANILAEWKSPAEEVSHTLPARAYVQTTRIFREAVSNIIKHSGATHCVVGCSVLDGDFMVVIQDNGQGIGAELDGRLDKGHGMSSMKARAKQMHGQCLVESGPGWGTVIRLTIPL